MPQKRITKKDKKIRDKSKKNIKSKSKSKSKSKNKSRKVTGGSCPACSGSVPIQNGGFGATSLQPIPVRYFYPINDYSSDPSAPSNIIEERNHSFIKGGRRRKMKGGEPILGNSNDVYTSFGNLQGAYSGAAVYNGTASLNSNNLDMVLNNSGKKYV